jgi:hypothetical protein
LLKLAIQEGLELPIRDAIALERRLSERYRMMSAPATTPEGHQPRRAKQFAR